MSSDNNGIRASEALHTTPRRARRKLAGGIRSSATSGSSMTPKPAKQSFSFSSSRDENAFAKSLVTPMRNKSSLGRLNINRRRRNSTNDNNGDNQTITSELQKSVISMDFTSVSAPDREDMYNSSNITNFNASTTHTSNINNTTNSPTTATTNAALDFTVNVLQGEDLIGLTSNIFGGCSSDPYVIVSVVSADDSSKEIATIGTTTHQSSTLNPKWNATLSESIPPGTHCKKVGDEYTLQIKLMNYDFLGDDTCMGIVKIPLTVGNISSQTNGAEWYEVPECEECPKATGRIQIAIDTKLQYSMDTFLSNNNNSKAIINNSNNEEEKGTETREEDPSLNVSSSSASSHNNNNISKTSGMSLSFSGHNNNKTTITTTTAATAATTASTMMANFFGIATGTSAAEKAKREAEEAAAAEKEKKEKEKHQIVGICEEEQVLCVMLTVHQGDNLVAKDRNAMGRFNSSDPYVVVEIWPKGAPINDDNYDKRLYPKLEFGRSKTIPKTLCPKWEKSFDPFNVPLDQLDMEEAQLRVRIMDDDFGVDEDDPMGNIDVHLQPKTMVDIAEKWYPVSRTSASRASGRVQISLLTLHAKQKKVVGTKTVEIQDQSLDESTIHESTRMMDSSRKDNNNDDEMGASKRFSFIKGDHSALGNALLQADRERHRSNGKRNRRNRRSISNLDGDTHLALNTLRSMDNSFIEDPDLIPQDDGKQQDDAVRSHSRRGGSKQRQQQQQQVGNAAAATTTSTMEDASAVMRSSRIRRTRSTIKDGGNGTGIGEERHSRRSVSRQRSNSVSVTRNSSIGQSEIIGGTSRRRESLERGGTTSRDRSSSKQGREKPKIRRSSTSGGAKPRTVRKSKDTIANDSNSSAGDTATTVSTTPPESPDVTKAMTAEEKKKRVVAKMGRQSSLTPRPTKQRISRSKSTVDDSSRIRSSKTGGEENKKKRRPIRKSTTLDDGDPRLRRPSSSLSKALDASDFVASTRRMDTASVISGASGFSKRSAAEASIASTPTMGSESSKRLTNSSKEALGDSSGAANNRRMDASAPAAVPGKNRGRRMMNASSRMDASGLGISRSSINGSGGQEGERRKGRRRSSVGTGTANSSSSGKPKSSSRSGTPRQRGDRDGPKTPRRSRSMSVQQSTPKKSSSSGNKRMSMAEVPDLKSIDDQNKDYGLLHLAYGGSQQPTAIPST